MYNNNLPKVISHHALKVSALNAEHTVFEIAEGSDEAELPKLGERVTLVPVYSDATMLLHRHVLGVRAGVVEDSWVVDANGLLQ